MSKKFRANVIILLLTLVFSSIAPPAHASTATKVAVTRSAPSVSNSGAAFTLQPQITIQDALGNTVTGSSAEVIATVSAGATLTGTASRSAVSGIATFTNLGITGIGGQTYTITYTAAGLDPASQTVRIARNCDGVAFDCVVGDIGPGGGTIFYISPTTFTQSGATGSMCTQNCKYLEAAPAGWIAGNNGSLDPKGSWSNNTVASTVQDKTTVTTQSSNASEKANWVIGQGFYNTSVMKVTGATTTIRDSIISYAGASNLNTAGQWFIPSINELTELCKWANHMTTGNPKTTCVATQNFKPGINTNTSSRYWSSTETSASDAWFLNIGNGVFSNANKVVDGNGYLSNFRPVRAFGTIDHTVSFDKQNNTPVSNAVVRDSQNPTASNPTWYGYNFKGWSETTNGVIRDLSTVTITAAKTFYGIWEQKSLAGLSNLPSPNTLTPDAFNDQTVISSRGATSTSVKVPAGALPNSYSVKVYTLPDNDLAMQTLGANNTYIISQVVAWSDTAAGSVGNIQDTAAGKPIEMTITSPDIKTGAKVYSILGNVSTLLATATQDGSVTATFSVDPVIVVQAAPISGSLGGVYSTPVFSPTPTVSTPPANTIAKSFNVFGFIPGSWKLTSTIKKYLESVLNSLAKPAKISCVGFTMGPTILRGDYNLAIRRGQEVCKYVVTNSSTIAKVTANGVTTKVPNRKYRRVSINLTY